MRNLLIISAIINLFIGLNGLYDVWNFISGLFALALVLLIKN